MAFLDIFIPTFSAVFLAQFFGWIFKKFVEPRLDATHEEMKNLNLIEKIKRILKWD